MISRKQFVLGGIAALIAATAGWLPAPVSAGGTVTFVPYELAAVRIDGDPPKEWSLYHASRNKTNEVVLLEWGKRFIRLDVHLKEALEIKADAVTREKNSVIWNGDNSAATILPSGEWTFRDGTLVQRLHLALTAESHEIDIDLPKTGK
jgi:hypothetical protein